MTLKIWVVYGFNGVAVVTNRALVSLNWYCQVHSTHLFFTKHNVKYDIRDKTGRQMEYHKCGNIYISPSLLIRIWEREILCIGMYKVDVQKF